MDKLETDNGPNYAWRALIAAIVLSAALILGYVLYANAAGKKRWNAHQTTLKEANQWLEVESLSVPDELNFTKAPGINEPDASESFHTLSRSQSKLSTRSATRKSGSGSNPEVEKWRNAHVEPLSGLVPSATGKTTEAEAAELILGKLEPNTAFMESVSSAALRPHARFPKDPTGGYLGFLRGVETFSLRARAHLELDHPEEALKDTLTGLNLCRLACDSPKNFHWGEGDLFFENLHAIWDGLRLRRWEDSQLARLEEHLALIDVPSVRLKRTRQAICRRRDELAEQLNAGTLREYWREMAEDTPRAYVIAKWAPTGWYYDDCVKFHTIPVETLFFPGTKKATTTTFTQFQNYSRRVNQSHGYRSFLTSELATHYSQWHKAFMAQAYVTNARVAIALERFRLANGAYPKTLSELSPQFLATVPADIVNGKDLKYLPSADGFSVYSIGANLKDDYGAPRESPTVGDWVWQYSLPTGVEPDQFRRHW